MPARPSSRTFLARASVTSDVPQRVDRAESQGDTATDDAETAADVTIDLTGHVPTLRVSSARSTEPNRPVDTRPPTDATPAVGTTPTTGAPRVAGAELAASGARWPWTAMVIVGALLVGVAAVSAIAYANYSTALRWKDRADAAQRHAATSNAQARTTQQQAAEATRARQVAQRRRRQVARQLAVSEADVSALEARVAALANERAQAQDIGVVVPAIDRPAAARTLQAQVDSCVSQVEAVRDGLASTTDAQDWKPAVAAALASCQQVAADLDALKSAAP